MPSIAKFDAAPVERTNISEEVADRIRSLILTGDIAPGEKLPSERVLAKKFGTNRNTLREALRMLEAQGLILIRQGLSAEVLDFRTAGNLSLLPHFLAEAGDTPEVIRVVRDLFIMRLDFNIRLARQAAGNISPDGKQKLLAFLEDLQRCRSDILSVMNLDISIYRVLARETKSMVNVWAINSFEPLYLFVVAGAPKDWSYPDLYFVKMEKVIHAIADGRPQAAERRMKDLLAHMDAIMFGILDEMERKIEERR